MSKLPKQLQVVQSSPSH